MSYPNDIREKAEKIKLLILDVDGVFTTGQVCLDKDGHEIKVFHSHDGYGIKNLQRQGIHVAIISGRNSKACEHRMKELGVTHIHQGIKQKLPVFESLLKELDLAPSECGYVGDDVPDIPVMERVGLKVAVANATQPVKDIADWQTTIEGGRGAVREVCDLIIHAQNKAFDHVT